MTGFTNLPGRGTGVVAGGIATGGGAIGAGVGALPVTGGAESNVAFVGLAILAAGVGLVVLAAALIRLRWSPKRAGR